MEGSFIYHSFLGYQPFMLLLPGLWGPFHDLSELNACLQQSLFTPHAVITDNHAKLASAG
jgi:hypothetical protein